MLNLLVAGASVAAGLDFLRDFLEVNPLVCKNGRMLLKLQFLDKGWQYLALLIHREVCQVFFEVHLNY